jgi:DNA-binding beta-propeller fold protein YncE
MRSTHRALASALVVLLGGCQMALRPLKPAPLLEQGQGELFVYLQPLPEQASALDFTVESVGARRADGGDVPLRVAVADLSGQGTQRQLLLASGRLPPGEYRSLQVKIRRAAVAGEKGKSDLLVGGEPMTVEVAFTLGSGQAQVIHVTVRWSPSRGKDFDFAPALTAALARRPVPALSGFVSSTGSDTIVVFDRRRREVQAVLPTGRDPRGVAVNRISTRVYVALTGDDQIQVTDFMTGADLLRARLQPGDQPRDLALTPDGRTLLVVNRGSNTASFVDAEGAVEVGRVPTGMDANRLLLDASGRRAFVFNTGSASISVIDVANRSLVRAVSTDPQPVDGRLNRIGNRLYVIHAASPYVTVYSVPDMAQVNRVHVGYGAASIEIDPRNDLVYLGRTGESRLQVHDPFTLLPIDHVTTPGPVSFMTIDPLENTLFALVPGSDQVAVVDLLSKRLLATMETGPEPFDVLVVGELR